ncbi:hypothetical protein J8J14_07360 [Roseomonas sp. SSH11]|uniref:AzlD domain-containing protein n=1 Tax=Pararoseomonas baculiformis TaxID=2820812 RepID=A0ABS4AC67_9PROT|nr:hypothetical protein [Pararoseomonas baculiformis]MBP0444598.1 hypothetical protein [Pararoseomonas baculiformis]
MHQGWPPLLAAIAAMLALRGLGMALAWRLPPGHPAITWATAVSEAALAAWVVLALLSPGPWPIPARLAGVAAALIAFFATGQRLLPGMAAGLAAIWLAGQLLG